MVQIWNEWFRDQNLFSPPYGDGTFYKLEKVYTKEFSPPYGDGIAYTHLDSGLLTEDDIAEVEDLAQAYYDALDAEDQAGQELKENVKIGA